jgi:uncharacterized membrane protein YhaH (DUF805 family)
MSFGQAIKSFFINYVNFKGRARRSEFWFAVLFTSLVSMAISIIAPGHTELVNGIEIQQSSALANLWPLATLLPSLSISWRRLHDVDKSGGWWFFVFLPIVGWILLLIQFVKDGQPVANRFGEPVKN